MRLPVWATAFALGIIFRVAIGPVAFWLTSMSACVIALPLFWPKLKNVAVALLVFAIGVGLSSRELRLAGESPTVEEDKPVEIMAQVERGGDIADSSALDSADAEADRAGHADSLSKRCHLRLNLHAVEGRPLSGTLSLLVLDGVPRLEPGDWVRFTTRLYLPRGFANPGLPDGRVLARAQGIDWVASVRSTDDLHRESGPAGPLAHCRRLAYRLRQAMASAINARLREPAAGFVRTMVIGERTQVPSWVEDGFRSAGATHVLSVSGLHLAVVVALVFHGLRRAFGILPRWSMRFPPRVLASALAVPVCMAYALLTGEAVATMRSAWMAVIVLGAGIVNRPLSLASSIAAAALILLAASPLTLLDVSFQLSFASVIGLGLFAGWLLREQARRPPGVLARARLWLARSLSASAAACLVTGPIVAHHFGEITPVAPVGNLVLVPVVELAVLPLGLVGGLLSLIHPWLGALPLLFAGWASSLALFLADLFRRFAPVGLVRFPTWGETFLLVAAVCCLLQSVAGRREQRRFWMGAGAVGLLLAGASMFVVDIHRRLQDDVRVTFLDVGQGDAALVEGPSGFVALVDGGGRYDDSFDTGARIVEPVLRAKGIGSIDLVILSHPHPDHMNGLFRILRRFSVRELWTNGHDGDNPKYRDLVALARERGVSIPSPHRIERGGLFIEPLGPWRDGAIGVPAGLGANDASLVVRLSFGPRRILFTGDIGSEGESEYVEGRVPDGNLACDVLKMPHHGSRYASSEQFLDASAPSLAVVSAGRFNRFRLPNPATLARYGRRNIWVLRTDLDGAITVSAGAKGELRASCYHPCPGPD